MIVDITYYTLDSLRKDPVNPEAEEHLSQRTTFDNIPDAKDYIGKAISHSLVMRLILDVRVYSEVDR